MGTFEDLKGKRFGKLLVIQRAENFEGESDSRIQWECDCDCGGIVFKTSRAIKKTGQRNACKKCMTHPCNEGRKGATFGRNVNGFKDPRIIIAKD